MKTKTDIPQVLVTGRPGVGGIAQQVGEWLTQCDPGEKWKITSAPTGATARRGRGAAITLFEAQDWAAAEVHRAAERLGAEQRARSHTGFVVFFSAKAKHPNLDDWTRVLQCFPEPSKVEIARGQVELRRTFEEVLCKVRIELKRQGSQAPRAVWEALDQTSVRHMPALEELSRSVEETLSKLRALQGRERGEKEEDTEELLGKARPQDTPAILPAPRPSPLDDVQDVLRATQDLREESGKLSALRTARLFGLSMRQLAEVLGRIPQTVTKTPAAQALQSDLGYFERIARLRRVLPDDGAFRKWLHSPNPRLGGTPPADLIEARDWQTLADLVDDILTGSPG